MVGRLKSFYMLHGHCRVHEHEGEELLEQWVQVQQMKEMRGTLSHEKQAVSPGGHTLQSHSKSSSPSLSCHG